MKVDLDDLRGFVAVAELGSFHAAADALHLSQPALTRRMQKLEATLGVQLIDRDTPPAAPELGRPRLLLQGEAAAGRAGRRRARHPRAGRPGVGRGDDRGGADRDLLFPAEGDRGLQRAVSAHPHPHPRPIGQRRAGGGQARPGRVRDQPIGGAGAGPRFRAAAARPVPVRLPQRSSAGAAASRCAGRTSRPTASSRSAGSAATGSSWTRRWPACRSGRAGSTRCSISARRWAWSRPGWASRRCPSSRHPPGQHPVLAVRPLVEPVVTRIMGIIRRHGSTLSPAAQQFHRILKGRWATEYLDERVGLPALKG